MPHDGELETDLRHRFIALRSIFMRPEASTLSIRESAVTETDFQDQFVANKGQPISFNGLMVHLAVRIPVAPGDQFRIRLVRATQSPIQGLKVRSDNAVMAAVNEVGKAFVVWDDTAPEETVVTVQKAKPGADVVFRNVWKSGHDGALMQGVRYAGMGVEHGDDGEIMLRCSDGRGDPDIDDLIARIRHVRANR